MTGSVHAAVWCDLQGEIQLLREDVGRHNGLDKLVGALARAGLKVEHGFIAVTSRASIEMVQKAAMAGAPMLAAVSAPTQLVLPMLVFSLGLVVCSGCMHLSFLEPQDPVAAAQRSHFYWVLGILAMLAAVRIYQLLPLFVWRDVHRLDPYTRLASGQAPLQIDVIGDDWTGLFIYPGQGIASIGTLALPTVRPIALRLTLATVLQSFFIPALGGQMYALGGMGHGSEFVVNPSPLRSFWFPVPRQNRLKPSKMTGYV